MFVSTIYVFVSTIYVFVSTIYTPDEHYLCVCDVKKMYLMYNIDVNIIIKKGEIIVAKAFTKVSKKIFKALKDKQITKAEFNFACLVHKFQNMNGGFVCSIKYGAKALRIPPKVVGPTAQLLIDKNIIVKNKNQRFKCNSYMLTDDYIINKGNNYFEIDNSLFKLLEDKKISNSSFTILVAISNDYKGQGNRLRDLMSLDIKPQTVKMSLKALLAANLITMNDDNYVIANKPATTKAVIIETPSTDISDINQYATDFMNLYRSKNGKKSDKIGLTALIGKLINKRDVVDYPSIKRALILTQQILTKNWIDTFAHRDKITTKELLDRKEDEYHLLIEEAFKHSDISEPQKEYIAKQEAITKHYRYLKDFPAVDLNSLPDILHSAPITYKDIFN